jgi:hypothetical protein
MNQVGRVAPRPPTYLAKPESAAAAQSHDLEGGIERTLLGRKPLSKTYGIVFPGDLLR